MESAADGSAQPHGMLHRNMCLNGTLDTFSLSLSLSVSGQSIVIGINYLRLPMDICTYVHISTFNEGKASYIPHLHCNYLYTRRHAHTYTPPEGVGGMDDEGPTDMQRLIDTQSEHSARMLNHGPHGLSMNLRHAIT